MNYQIEFYKQTLKDLEKIKSVPHLKKNVYKLLSVLENNPFKPPYEKLSGNLSGAYSRRINNQHRLVYMILEEQKIIRILSLWSHYENL